MQIPLLRDCHTHPMLYAAFEEGLNLGEFDGHGDMDPTALRTSALARIREHSRGRTSGWTLVYGWNSGRFSLSKEDFDDLSPLVIFNLSLHGLIINDTGRTLLERADAEAARRLDDQQWLERNLQRFLNVFATSAASPERLRQYFNRLLVEHGLYHAEEMLLVDEREVHLLERAGLLGRTRLWAAPELHDAMPPHVQAKVHGVKLFADGALGARTAALHRPYQHSSNTGMLMYNDGELRALLRRYFVAGTPVALHAIGDRAIDAAVNAAEAAGIRNESTLRLEHAQLISVATARKAKTLGIHLCMQPNFSDDSIHYADRLPHGYAALNNPFRMLIDEVGYVPGRDLFFGSDGMPHGVREALRQSLFPPCAGQVLTMNEFVAGYCMPTRDAGHIEVDIDHTRRSVDCRIVVRPESCRPST